MKEQHNCPHTAESLAMLQALSLNEKVFESRLRIAEWVEHYGEDNVYVAFSGGKDSTVLLDLVRRDYPSVPAVFCDTGLEFPEIRDFVKTIDNVTWVKPAMNFKAVIEKYGYPVVSKEQAMAISRYRNTNDPMQKYYRTHGFPNGKKGMISKKWQYLIDAPFKISERCCNVMKKNPLKAYEKNSGNMPMIGVMASESDMRTRNYLDYGCNAFETKSPQSRPVMFWSDSDIWEYLKTKSIPYSSIYDMGYSRTGCAFCAFGAHLECTPNRFQRMQDTHPRLWTYCMDKLGMREVLKECDVPIEDNQMYLELGEEE